MGEGTNEVPEENAAAGELRRRSRQSAARAAACVGAASSCPRMAHSGAADGPKQEQGADVLSAEAQARARALACLSRLSKKYLSCGRRLAGASGGVQVESAVSCCTGRVPSSGRRGNDEPAAPKSSGNA